jgi:hypothetical protein
MGADNQAEAVLERMAKRKAWYAAHNCVHAHCPNECEHPQPFVDNDGDLICGSCWYFGGGVVLMLPCTTDICEE